MVRDALAPWEMTVSEAAPLICGPFTSDPFECACGVWLWAEPTGEQVAEWLAEYREARQ